MSGLDLRALREAAEAAICERPGQCASGGNCRRSEDFDEAARPTAILALIDRLEAAEGAVERARKVIEDRHAGDFAPILPKLAAALDGTR